jgi:hypothetical protein
MKYGGGVLLACIALALSSAPTTEAQAKDAFHNGETAFRADDYELALQHFRRAIQLAPHDAVRFNIAVCLERLGRFREALLEYEAAAKSKVLDDAARARARDQAERVRERLGTLVIDTEPSGAEVKLDGVAVCSAPCELSVDPRRHELEATFEGRSAHDVVTAERGRKLSVHLAVPEAAAVPPSTEVAVVTASSRQWFGPPAWVGVAVAVIGAAAFTGFGLRATSLHQQYVSAPTVPTRNEGILMRDTANASLAVACVGALVVLLDVLWWSRWRTT